MNKNYRKISLMSSCFLTKSRKRWIARPNRLLWTLMCIDCNCNMNRTDYNNFLAQTLKLHHLGKRKNIHLRKTKEILRSCISCIQLCNYKYSIYKTQYMRNLCSYQNTLKISEVKISGVNVGYKNIFKNVFSIFCVKTILN